LLLSDDFEVINFIQNVHCCGANTAAETTLPLITAAAQWRSLNARDCNAYGEKQN